ncbi:hypothetical protein L6164_025757 [Bauhinia variegata]|uniref:Uncharacterized protein n=1 Tax=Bauhinia variegata TaxID=167791 RepID=A0ACB9M1V8_BAUVA|nr:hypothetical protein L6164_025757 [Bauhinia variegata]
MSKTREEQKGNTKMTSSKQQHVSLLLLFLLCFLLLLPLSHAQREPNSTGYQCTENQNQTGNSCQTYVFYRAKSPDFLDLASIGDLFSVSRLMISNHSNISSPSAPLIQDQPLFVPISCSCNNINSTFGSISYAGLSYIIKPNDTFYLVSTNKFQNLTTYESVELVNPTLVATDLQIGTNAIFPVFCKCPNSTQLQNRQNYLISYVVQPSDNVSSIASTFGTDPQSIIDINGNNPELFDTIFVPVTQLPELSQPATAPSPSPTVSAPAESDDRKGTVIGLAIGLGIIGLLLILVIGVWIYREVLFKDKLWVMGDEERQRRQFYEGTEKKGMKEEGMKLMANVSDCLDKYRVFGIEELREATNGFHDSFLIQGSVYKGTIAGEVFAIKKMKWNAYEELKILQKVNHGNLVKLEGFCIDTEEANCYLIYEYVENGSLYSWLHEHKDEKLNWKTRLRIAIDVANGLQYIHEHTRPRVVHKDIKSSNILLDSNMRAKIANFGLAKSGCNAITMHIVGTQGYIPPEYLADGVVSTKMDVFSFGVVLLELISAREAIDEDGNLLWASATRVFEGNDEKEKARKLMEWIDRDILRETCSMESLMSVLNMALGCLHRDPSKRPSMVETVYTLSKSEEAGFESSDDGLGTPKLTAR